MALFASKPNKVDTDKQEAHYKSLAREGEVPAKDGDEHWVRPRKEFEQYRALDGRMAIRIIRPKVEEKKSETIQNSQNK